MELICPSCHMPLAAEGRSLRCGQNHSFDLARQGYVNLLPVQQKRSLHPGDTREQVLSRRAFLETGAYGPIVEAVKAAGLTPMTDEIQFLPFWEKGVRFFKVLDPNNAPVEFCQIL